MNTQLLWKFAGGAVSSGLAAVTVFIVDQCNMPSLDKFLAAAGLAVAGGVFHYVKNYYSHE